MTKQYGFELISEEYVEELASTAKLWRHTVTGAQLLSMSNIDENKVFGVTFRTPPENSTGVAHILEHSVLCGSEKYPVKEPFVELLKSSLQTFLNAFTYPDKTCYPVASTNLQDFYNLIDVYIDAAFFPKITEHIFQQEGWHYEMENPDAPLTYKGVVFNEMKGVYSSPDSMLSEKAQQSLFPDMTYGLDSGGDPATIPHLTYEQFQKFHETFYHPANARFFFWGDDPEEERLAILGRLLDRFGPLTVDSSVPLQGDFPAPRSVVEGYPAGEDDTRAMFTINWLLPETRDVEANFALQMLEQMLIGMPASPLRKALIESGLGEDIAGVGLENELRQMYFSTGLKGIERTDAGKVEALIFDTLRSLAENGIDKECIEAAINSVEFDLRENNTGRFPVGLAVMVHSLTTWLYDGDPLALLAYEKPLARIKEQVSSGAPYFEDIIRACFLSNTNRSTVLMVPDSQLADTRKEDEERRLAAIRETLNSQAVTELISTAETLKKIQETPDDPEAVAAIPRLTLENISRTEKAIPHEEQSLANIPIYFHNLETSGIAYITAGFDISTVPQELLPLLPLLGRSMTEMGTAKRDFVQLGMRIAAKTGGIGADTSFTTKLSNGAPVSRLMLQGKSTVDKAEDLFALLQEVLLETNLDDKERFKAILLEEKAREEQRLVPSGHIVVMSRLRAHYSVAGWLGEVTGGVDYLLYLRKLVERIDTEWEEILSDLAHLRELIACRNNALLNVTLDTANWRTIRNTAEKFIQALPDRPLDSADWHVDNFPKNEGFAIPAQVNYVGKAANIYDLGYTYHGSANVIFKHLRMGWLWDKVRVQGGAYGAFCSFDRATGVLAQVSYRDPNLMNTLDIYDKSAEYLANLSLSQDDLEKAIIGTIGDIDAHMLPDAKGMTALMRHLTNSTEEIRLQTREEILSTTLKDFHNFAEIMSEAAKAGNIAILGGAGVKEATEENNWQYTELM